MVRLFFAALVASLFMCSCSPGNDEGDITVLKEVNNSLVLSNDMTRISTTSITQSLEDKTRDPVTSERATKWLSKATTIKTLTDSILLHIQRIKSDLIEEVGFDPLKEEKPKSARQAVDHIFKDHREGELLHEKLALYKRDLLSIITDSVFQQHMRGLISITGTEMVSNADSFSDRYFSTTALGAVTMLNKIENDIRTTENKLTTLFHQQTAFIDHSCHSYSAIISQNATIVKPLDNMEILAGIAAFDVNAKPIVTVGRKEIPLTERAYARYAFKASPNPGTFRVPVQIKFVDPNSGKEVVVKKTIEYTVKPDQ